MTLLLFVVFCFCSCNGLVVECGWLLVGRGVCSFVSSVVMLHFFTYLFSHATAQAHTGRGVRDVTVFNPSTWLENEMTHPREMKETGEFSMLLRSRQPSATLGGTQEGLFLVMLLFLLVSVLFLEPCFLSCHSPTLLS